jgi:hypothetical protein
MRYLLKPDGSLDVTVFAEDVGLEIKSSSDLKKLEEFANLVIEMKRDDCIRLCYEAYEEGWGDGALQCINNIESRGEK